MTRRKSEVEKALAGTARPDRRRPARAKAAPGTLMAPSGFNPAQKRAWRRLVDCARAAGHPLTPADEVALASAAQLLELFNRALDAVRRAPLTVPDGRGALRKHPSLQAVRDCSGPMLAYLARLGLTPTDRAKLTSGDDDGAPALGDALRAISEGKT
jgi:P27 family predicted phage terminase small subunit